MAIKLRIFCDFKFPCPIDAMLGIKNGMNWNGDTVRISRTVVMPYLPPAGTGVALACKHMSGFNPATYEPSHVAILPEDPWFEEETGETILSGQLYQSFVVPFTREQLLDTFRWLRTEGFVIHLPDDVADDIKQILDTPVVVFTPPG